IHTSPYSQPEVEYYHWHLEIIPRLTRVAGFEWGTGFYINYMAPEEAVKHLTGKNERGKDG
ncbi:galactose-1-phosphate uridylyltransferase, partial [Candidatus Aerophobetes bacterium]|nr:galactose-1-phosphate uridylyltransferase [Candidatus Aerophobetes bacterium]